MDESAGGSASREPSSGARRVSKALAETTRLEAFSDGVFAIVLPLLILDLRAPSGDGPLLDRLVHQWPSYVAYLASFAFVAVVWVNHHSTFTRIRQVDSGLMWRNILLLLVTSIFPFPTAVLGETFQHGTRDDQTVALALYAAVGAVNALTWWLLFHHVEKHPELIAQGVGVTYFREGRTRALVGIVSYLVAIGVALVEPWAALALNAVLPIFYGVTSGGSVSMPAVGRARKASG